MLAQAHSRLVLLSDADMAAARGFRLTFREGAATRTLLHGLLGVRLAGSDGRPHGELPVPAVVLVVDGVVRFVHADPDYSRRLEPEALLGAARAAVATGVPAGR